MVTHIWLNNHRKWRHYTHEMNGNVSHSCFLIPASVEYPWCLQLQSDANKVLWTSCNQAGFSSWSSSASSLSSLTIPSSMLSSLSLWPSRYLGLGPALVLKIPAVRLRSSPNKVSLASFSIAFARQDAKVSRDLWTSAWIWMDAGLSFSAGGEKKKKRGRDQMSKILYSSIWLQRRCEGHVPLDCSTWSSKVTELLLFAERLLPWCWWWEEPSVEKLSNSITSVPAWGTIQTTETAVWAAADVWDPTCSSPKAMISAAQCAVKQKHEAQPLQCCVRATPTTTS